MNLLDRSTAKEIELLNDIGLKVENKEYTKEELRMYESEIEDFIMSHSTKNGDISRFVNRYNSILNTIINEK